MTHVALIGPDPASPQGGVAVAMDGYRLALERAGLLDSVVPAYLPGHRLRPTLRAVGPMMAAVRRGSVVYAHAGGPVSVFRKTRLLALARAMGARTMLQIHSAELDDMTRTTAARAALRCTLRSVDVLGVVGDYWKRLLTERVSGLPPIVVIPNPLPSWAATRSPPTARPSHDGPLRLLCMTRLQPGKGVGLAIESMLHVRDGHLTIAGDGPLRDELKALVRRLGLTDRVRFAGWLDHDRKVRALQSADLFLLPTRYDSFGMGFIEAASVGTPSIALRWGAIPEVVVHEQTGLLVDEATPQAIGLAIERLHSQQLRDKLGLAAHDRAHQRYGSQAIADAVRGALADHLCSKNTQKG